MGLVYLIHFERPLAHAKHYIGWTCLDDPRARLEQHKAGRGARLLAVLNELGIGYQIVRVWRRKSRRFERSLKNRKKAACFCPVCSEKHKRRLYVERIKKNLE